MMPVLARVYHIPPHLQADLTLREFKVLRADLARLEAEQNG